MPGPTGSLVVPIGPCEGPIGPFVGTVRNRLLNRPVPLRDYWGTFEVIGGTQTGCSARSADSSKPFTFSKNRNNPGTGPQTGQIDPIGPQRANRGWPGALPKIPENWKITQKLGFGGVLGETGTSKHILGTIQSIWVAGFPRIPILEPFLKQNHVFRKGLAWLAWLALAWLAWLALVYLACLASAWLT